VVRDEQRRIAERLGPKRELEDDVGMRERTAAGEREAELQRFPPTIRDVAKDALS
jgi:hypothetical protein